MSEDWNAVLELAEKCAREVGSRVRAVLCGDHAVSVSLKGMNDPVTDIDHYSEKLIEQAVISVFPHHRLLSEEQQEGKGTNPRRFQEFLNEGVVWVVDPIDGTTNLAAQNPYCCISIGITENGRPVAGIIYDPSRDELFSAIRGKGAFLNGKPIRTNRVTQLGDAVVSMGFPRDYLLHWHECEKFMSAALQNFRSLRVFGSAALDIASVACGRLSGFFHEGLKPWDVTAGAIILEEAGGKCFHFRDPIEPFTPGAETYAFCTPGIQDDFLKLLLRVDAENHAKPR